MRDFFPILIVFLALVCILTILVLAFVDPCALAHYDPFSRQSFCRLCGVQIMPYCPVCLVSYSSSSDFCTACGSPLVEVTGDE